MEAKKERVIIREPYQKITQPILSYLEKARVLSILAEQIANGRSFDQEILEEVLGEKDLNIEIAQRLLERGETNLIIYRNVGDNTDEEWHVDEMSYYS